MKEYTAPTAEIFLFNSAAVMLDPDETPIVTPALSANEPKLLNLF